MSEARKQVASGAALALAVGATMALLLGLLVGQ